MSRHQVRLRVRYAETDQMGVVYHSNYLIWMEIGRVELVRARGFNYKDLEHSEGILLSVVEAQCRYLYPARYDDEILVETEVTRANARMIEFGYEIRAAASQRLLATGMTKHCWLNREMRPTKLPTRYHSVLILG
jgi:acyl-CoA thioester hydrolase